MADEISFEEALKKLEDIVARMEGGDLNLEESLKSFEEGVALTRLCEKKLDEAEKKVEILMKDKNGRLTAMPFPRGEAEDDEGI